MKKNLSLLLLIFLESTLFFSCSKKVVRMESSPPPPPSKFEASSTVRADARPMMLQERHSNVRQMKKMLAVEKRLERIPPEAESESDESVSPQPDEPGDAPIPPPALEIQQQVPEQKKPVKRMVTYTGSVTTRSTNPDSLLETALLLAKSVDGYIERRYDLSITLRVPSEKFSFVYDSLLTLGEMVSFVKSSEDITDAFRDTEQRIRILAKTIERYVKLLPLVKKEREKIALLKEIEKLRERLELLKVRKKTLSRRADFATIHFTVQQRGTGYDHYSDQAPGKGFEWISSLSPFEYRKFGAKLKYPIPEGMVRLKKKKMWAMQSAAGTRVWSGKLRNKPKADTRFWIKAITFRLKDSYRKMNVDTIGDYQVLHFIPFPGSNYRYAVAVKVVKNKIHVIQCFFPDATQEQRYFKAISVALGGKAVS